ncbi:MAG TPA: MTAP family purine nucleoside phosphorylase [Plantibacter sp.]|uniref:MTAP family purine nucleoside phosphorylase n=1 Tax=unclassified Plantibacter TaxID=2624265 RepID=UPI002B7D5C1C|nr:MTAP family purine nucleoside phosphorylase [Plantibacter sp.]
MSIPIAVIGGSGLSTVLDPTSAESLSVPTPYRTVEVLVGELGGRTVAFVPRHGAGHSVPPHRIDSRATVWALASLGVHAIISTAAVGSINTELPVGRLVVVDQYLDRTNGRQDTFYEGPDVQHLPSAEPFCPELRTIAASTLGPDVSVGATVAVIQGPRFSTRAESRWLAAAGADLLNMTLYPEVPLAAELNIGTLTLAFVTDEDAADDADPVDAALVFARLAEAKPRIVDAIERIVAAVPVDYRARTLISAAAVERVLQRRTS